MTKIKMIGRKGKSPKNLDQDFTQDLYPVHVETEVVLGTARGTVEEVVIDAQEDDVLELELEDGLVLLTSIAQLREDLAEWKSRGEILDAELLDIPAELPVLPPSRGPLSTFAIRALRHLRVDQKVAELSALALAKKLENKLEPGPGLYPFQELFEYQRVLHFDGPPPETKPKRLEADEVANLKRENGQPLTENPPYLIFIHGTASNTFGSFDGLVHSHPELWRDLTTQYGDRLLAFDHCTWSTSPIENARDLLKLLPEDARIHLVTYSRGGLIGELLCRGQLLEFNSLRQEWSPRVPFDFHDKKLFEDDDNPSPGRLEQRAALEELDQLLRDRQPKIERYVRVACPARGTTLASKRLDRFLSILLNLIGFSTGITASPLYQTTKALLIAFANQRTRPEILPGLEAMLPTSPLIRLLNQPGLAVEADLSVVAGDVEGSGLLGKLKVFATDVFFATQHDLVVDTPSMYGGQLRHGTKTRFVFNQGTDVNHFRYFNNFDTAQCICQGVLWTQEDDLEGFEAFDQPDPSTPLRRNWLRDLISRGELDHDLAEERPVVFLLPGIMGSHLAVDGNRIWVDLSDLAKGRLRLLEHDQPVTADALVDSAYRDLAEFLSQSQEVIPFPYDWRSSLLEAGRLLGAAIQTKLDETDQPVRLLAHSMGGMVARAMMLECPEVWKALCDRGGRLVMLGTPNQGSHVISRVLVGQEGLLKNLALLDLRNSRKEVLEIVSRFRGLLELLPLKNGDELDLFKFSSWKDLKKFGDRDDKWQRPIEKDLEAAWTVRKRFNQQTLDPDHVLYVAGSAPSTPVSIRPKTLNEEEDENKKAWKIEFLAVRQGDGRVLWSTGIPEGIRAWYMDVVHGKLAAHKPAFDALLDLVLNGRTSRLPTNPPAQRGDQQPPFLLPDDEVHLFPNKRDFESLFVGNLGEVERDIEPPVRVQVAQGNLAFARHPLVVGHYEKDAIVSAEAALDRRLEGLLSQRHRLGRYPGPLDSAEVLFAPKGVKPEGAIIVGLGKVGLLTAGRLRSSLRHGFLEYAQRKTEQFRSSDNLAPSNDLSISALLIGSGEGGVPLIESLRSMLQAILATNAQLAAQKIEMRIRNLEIVELYEDLAIGALRTLESLEEDPTLRLKGRPRFEIVEPLLQKLPGGRRRIQHRDDENWWHRLQIQRVGDALNFDSLSRRARSEKEQFVIDDCILAPLLDTATLNARADEAVCKTLFELLLPNSFKDHAPDERALLLILDKASAVYPWELMIDPSQDNAGENRDAQALRAGLIRQLSLEENDYRRQPRYADSGRALVIGDTQAPEPWAPLPGAQDEAQKVGKLLKQHAVDTEVRIRPSGTDVVKLLIPGNFRILHLAGHGVYNSLQPDSCGKRVSGMVLGDGIYLHANVVDRIRPVPELVFLNCCFLGKIEEPESEEEPAAENNLTNIGSRAALAANLATQFIKMGAKAVVAAGWMVDDKAALTFAETFYARMLSGDNFGESVLQARKAAARYQKSTNTWGAYQCYGDPHFVLRPSRGSSPSSDHHANEAPSFVSPSELKVRLENMVGEAETSTLAKVKRLRALLKTCEETLPPAWHEIGGVRTAFGRAYAELGLFGHAIQAYRRAVTAANASASLTDIEQLANLECRLASMIEAGQTMGGEADRAIINDTTNMLRASCDRRLQQLEQLGGMTIERHILSAAANKRKALKNALIALRRQGKTTQELKACKASLQSMLDAYKKAHELHRKNYNKLYPYPLHSWLIGRVLLAPKSDDFSDVASFLNQTHDMAERQDSREPSFWNGIIAAENLLVRYLVSNDIEEASGLSTHYLRARERGASPRQIQSVLEHLNFVATLLEVDLVSTKKAQKARETKAKVIREVYQEFYRESGARHL